VTVPAFSNAEVSTELLVAGLPRRGLLADNGFSGGTSSLAGRPPGMTSLPLHGACVTSASQTSSEQSSFVTRLSWICLGWQPLTRHDGSCMIFRHEQPDFDAVGNPA
jgi:hypothetical protein